MKTIQPQAGSDVQLVSFSLSITQNVTRNAETARVNKIATNAKRGHTVAYINLF